MHTATLTTSPPHALNHSLDAADRTEAIRAVVLGLCYFVVADLGLMTSCDGAIFAVAAALVLPVWRPYIVLLVISVHDAPGQADPYIYAAVTGIGLIMLVSTAIVRVTAGPTTNSQETFRRLSAFSIAVVFFGIASSYWHHRLGLHEQSAERPYYIVGGLIILMLLLGAMSHKAIENDPLSSVRLRTICMLAIGHMMLVALLQLKMGPQFLASANGIHSIESAHELIDGGSRGMARLTGPFLSPNTLAMLPAFYLCLYLRGTRQRMISDSFIIAFLTVGFMASLLGGARSMFAYYFAGAAALMWTKSPVRVLALSLLALPMLVVVSIPWDEMLMMMRMQDLQELGTRGEFWQASLQNMSAQDWLWGFGISHWPVFFTYYTGSSTSDPHNWVLSMGGNYGIVGLFFYFVLGCLLLHKSLTGPKKFRAIAVCLGLMFFGRDLANTQYVMNNHPMCCLYWLTIGSVFLRESDPHCTLSSKA